ncbi:MAG: SDR family oxidoreductase [Salinisphaera sp.]|nr:SDR family oxidoreductase [Salinisphaera sp.]
MSLPSLQDKKCLITGAASGIGRAVALAVAAEGGELFLTDIDPQGLASAEQECRAAGAAIRACMAFDIADYDAVRAFAEQVHAEHGSLDVVMNVAGIAIWGTVDRLEHKHWRQAIEVNLMGPIHVIECFIPPMMAAGRGGHLVNVSSAAGLFGLPWHAAYSASKFGLRGVSEVLRFDLAEHRIGVSLVCPGGVDTELVRSVNIVGLDRDHKEVTAMAEHFRRHAVSPQQAAKAILKGIKANRYLIYTSPDVRIGHWFQRKFSPGYDIAMGLLNRRFRQIDKRVNAPTSNDHHRGD